MKPTSPFTTVYAALLVLSACSSSDDDATPADDNTSAGETSMPAPDGESGDQEISSDPSGDDTSAIAGLWDAGSGETDDRDERYVEISGDGLYTDYDYRQDATGDEGNCYIITPMTLDLETGADESGAATFSIADGRSFTATAVAATLSVTFLDDTSMEGAEVEDETLNWPAVSGIAAADLPVCADPG
mgnify:CR=1 FL=1